MTICSLGHYGIPLLFFPTTGDSPMEIEESGLFDAVGEFVRSGKCRVYCIGSVHSQSWGSGEITFEAKSRRHFEYNNYLMNEAMPFIYDDNGGAMPILTVGASLGAYYAANAYFRRPDVFIGALALSGDYNIERFTEGHFDENCYFNSPTHYLPNLNDNYWLSFLRSRRHIYIATGSGEGERPEKSAELSNLLELKSIPHLLDVWGGEWRHGVETWSAMLQHYIGTKL